MVKQGRGNMIVVDITSSALDVHVNNVGSKSCRLGLGIAVALLAVIMGRAIDPKSCFVGVSGYINDIWLHGTEEMVLVALTGTFVTSFPSYRTWLWAALFIPTHVCSRRISSAWWIKAKIVCFLLPRMPLTWRRWWRN